MQEILTVKNLIKTYSNNFKAVDDVSFGVKEGEIFGILGPNGAGKTTTLEIIEGLRSATEGSVTLGGLNALDKRNSKKLQEIIGIQLQSSSYFDLLSLKEILDLFGSFYKQKLDSIELLEMVGLTEKQDSLVKNLSGGQAQRFSIVAALVNNPKIVFLDEPTTGLDPQVRRNLWEIIREINKKGKTIILTTHYMEEAQELCDRVAIMDAGKIIMMDSPVNLIKSLDLKFTIKFSTKEPLTKNKKEEFENNKLVLKFWEEKEKYVFRIENPNSIDEIIDWFNKNDIIFTNLEMLPPNLEDVFLKMTGKALRN